MKVRHSLLKFCLVLPLVLSSCSETEQHSQPGALDILLPWMESEGNYSYQPVRIESLKNLRSVEGPYGQFYYQPTFGADGLRGSRPQARLIELETGQYIPGDFLSTQLFTIYAHLERLGRLDEELGIDSSQRAPRKVGVTLPISGDISSRDAESRNNAYYMEHNTLLFLPYRLNKIPVGINAGVVAHEHFHSHFHYLVKEPLLKVRPQIFTMAIEESEVELSALNKDLAEQWAQAKQMKPQSYERFNVRRDHLYMNVLMGALNEGLADYWGWMYSGQNDFVGDSLILQSKVRNLSEEPRQIHTRNEILRDLGAFITAEPEIVQEHFIKWARSYYYAVGTNIARIMRALTTHSKGGKLTGEVLAARQKEIAQRLLLTMKKWAEETAVNPRYGDLTLSDFFVYFLETGSTASTSECKLIQGLMAPNEATPLYELCQIDSPGRALPHLAREREAAEIDDEDDSDEFMGEHR